MEPVALDRIQRVIDHEAAEHFGADAAPKLVLLHHGDHPAIEPGELYLQLVLGQDDPPWDAWTEERRDRVWDFLAQRLHEAKGLMIPPTGIMMLDGVSDIVERARDHAPVLAQLGSADLHTLDALITAGLPGIGASRSDATRWALARVREQPVYAQLSVQAQGVGAFGPGGFMDRVARDRRQTELAEQVKRHFPGGEVQRVALLRHGDDPWVEPGDLMVRVIIEEAGEEPDLRTWEREHEAISRELHRELAEKVPEARYLEFWFGGDTGRQGQSRQRLRCPPEDGERDLTMVDIRLGPVDREMLDTLITAGIAGSRAEAISWVLARIRDRPAYARLEDRARELAELKARF